jgi:excisionase family DNA binding protein
MYDAIEGFIEMTDNNSSVMLERETVSIEQAAKILGIGRNQAYAAVRRGEIHVVGLTGSRWRVPRREIERLLNGVAVGRA